MATGTNRQCTRRRTPSHLAATLIPQHQSFSTLLSCLILATRLPFAAAVCGVEILYPQSGLTFYYLDTINVTYTSNFTDPTLFAWCGQGSPAKKFETSAPKYNGSVLVLLDFSSSDPCWFDLRPNTPACGDNSPSFTLLPVQRSHSDTKSIFGLGSSPNSSSGGLSTGAKAGIAVAVLGISVVVVAMAACFFFRRRKRRQEADVAGHIIDHDSRAKGHEKRPLPTGTPAHSNLSKEPLRTQPIYDGLSASGGYDDAQSRGSSSYLQSPQSPSSTAGFFPPAANKPPEKQYLTEREELEAARLHSKSVSSGVVSYGPNPVTPCVTPRPSTRFHDNPSSGSGEEFYPTSIHSISPQPQPQYPVKPAPPPLVVSYGPNKITPTPVIASIAPDESIMKGPPDLPFFPINGFPSQAFDSSFEPPSAHDTIQTTPQDLIRQDRSDDLARHDIPDDLVRYDLSDDPASTIAPLPPYATTADFYAMEKGAIRKLEEPAAQAELPPTKDGYYHFGDHSNEYELQGAAPEREQLHPHRPYRDQAAAGGVGRRGGPRDVDEQKFLLDDEEMRYLREQKRMIRAAQQGESYEMQPARATGSREP